MGKLFNSFLISALIVLALALIDGSQLVFTPILNLFVNPTSSAGNIFSQLLTNAITAVGLSAFIIGTFVIKLDWLTRASLFVTLESFILGPMVGLWNKIASSLSAFGTCNGSAICSQLGQTNINTFGALIAGLIIGPIILYAIWSGEEYVWGGDR